MMPADWRQGLSGKSSAGSLRSITTSRPARSIRLRAPSLIAPRYSLKVPLSLVAWRACAQTESSGSKQKSSVPMYQTS
jgi:hypothetical protein